MTNLKLPKQTIMDHAITARNYIEMKFLPKHERVENISAHMNDCIYNPTSGLIARKQYILNNSNLSRNNISGIFNRISKHPTIQYLNNILEDRMQELYPKTKKIREYIINDDRLNMLYVKKSRGYNLLDKLKIFFKR